MKTSDSFRIMTLKEFREVLCVQLIKGNQKVIKIGKGDKRGRYY